MSFCGALVRGCVCYEMVAVEWDGSQDNKKTSTDEWQLGAG